MVNPRAWLAEAIATFGLVFFGPLSVILAAAWYGDGLSTEAVIFISLGHGGIIVFMVYAFGHISGAHINPAVTIPMMITKQIDVKNGIGYILFQIMGAVVATLSLQALFPEIGKKVFWGAHGGPSELLGNSMISGLAVEIILTFFLVVVIYMTAVHIKAPKQIYGGAIGGMVFLLHLVGVPTNRCLNESCTFLFTYFSIWRCRFMGSSMAILGRTNHWWYHCRCCNELSLR